MVFLYLLHLLHLLEFFFRLGISASFLFFKDIFLFILFFIQRIILLNHLAFQSLLISFLLYFSLYNCLIPCYLLFGFFFRFLLLFSPLSKHVSYQSKSLISFSYAYLTLCKHKRQSSKINVIANSKQAFVHVIKQQLEQLVFLCVKLLLKLSNAESS